MDVVHRLIHHDPTKPDYVLAEWILADALGLHYSTKVIPIFIGTINDDETIRDDLQLNGIIESLGQEKTLSFVKEQLQLLQQQRKLFTIDLEKLFPAASNWKIKLVVQRMLRNLGVQWSDRFCIKKCLQGLLRILAGDVMDESMFELSV